MYCFFEKIEFSFVRSNDFVRKKLGFRQKIYRTRAIITILDLKPLLGGVLKLRLQDLAFFDHLPPSVYIFYVIKVYKKLIFLTTYPLLL